MNEAGDGVEELDACDGVVLVGESLQLRLLLDAEAAAEFSPVQAYLPRVPVPIAL